MNPTITPNANSKATRSVVTTRLVEYMIALRGFSAPLSSRICGRAAAGASSICCAITRSKNSFGGRFDSADKDVDYSRYVRIRGVVAREKGALAQHPCVKAILECIQRALHIQVLPDDS